MYRLLIFGTGKACQLVKKNLNYEKVEIVAYIDNDESKHNKLYEDKVIISPNEILNTQYDYIIIASSAYYEIGMQLVELGVNRKCIIPYFKQNVIKSTKEIFKNELSKNKYFYELVLPFANYAPWLGDEEFLKVYNKIKNNTLVDIYRCYELWKLVEQCSKLDGALIEIGVWRGGSSAIICERAKLSNNNNIIYLADTFTGVVKSSDEDNVYVGGEHSDTSEEYVKKLLSKEFNIDNYQILKGIFPDETCQFIKDEKFSFCHVDVDVYKSAKDIVEWIWEKMTIGGIIVFDDYGFDTCDGVTTYIEEERKKDDRIIIHNLNGHAIMVKIR